MFVQLLAAFVTQLDLDFLDAFFLLTFNTFYLSFEFPSAFRSDSYPPHLPRRVLVNLSLNNAKLMPLAYLYLSLCFYL